MRDTVAVPDSNGSATSHLTFGVLNGIASYFRVVASSLTIEYVGAVENCSGYAIAGAIGPYGTDGAANAIYNSGSGTGF